MTMPMRLLAKLASPQEPTNVQHYAGLPPELTEGADRRRAMGAAILLLIEETDEGVFLYRFGAQGDCVGDTWHLSVDEAKDQAAFEYPLVSLDWQTVPADVRDAVFYGLGRGS